MSVGLTVSKQKTNADFDLVYQSSLLDADLQTSGQLFDVNVFGVLNVVQEFSTLLIAAQGTIVNIGSILGRMPLPFQGIYNASKAALEQISRTLRIELSPFNVKVIHVGIYVTKRRPVSNGMSVRIL